VVMQVQRMGLSLARQWVASRPGVCSCMPCRKASALEPKALCRKSAVLEWHMRACLLWSPLCLAPTPIYPPQRHIASQPSPSRPQGRLRRRRRRRPQRLPRPANDDDRTCRPAPHGATRYGVGQRRQPGVRLGWQEFDRARSGVAVRAALCGPWPCGSAAAMILRRVPP
jgi:hypothetical protein